MNITMYYDLKVNLYGVNWGKCCGTVPVMCCNRCGTWSVLKHTDSQTVISEATQLSCHPVRQTCTAVPHRATSQWLVKVDGLEIRIQKQAIASNKTSLHLKLTVRVFSKSLSYYKRRCKCSKIHNLMRHSYHVGRECLEAARLWFAGKRQFQDPSFEHV